MIEMRLTVRRRYDVELDDEERKRVWIQGLLEQRWTWRRNELRGWEPDEVEAVLEVEDFRGDTPFSSHDVVNTLFHLQRAQLLHKLEDIPRLVVRDWGETDDERRPHEVVQIIVALGSAGVITALVNLIKVWLEKDKVRRVTIRLPDGATLSVERATASEIQGFITTASQLLLSQDAKETPPEKS